MKGIGLPIKVGAAKCFPHHYFSRFAKPCGETSSFIFKPCCIRTANQQMFSMIIDQLQDFPPLPIPSKITVTVKKCAKTGHTKHCIMIVVANINDDLFQRLETVHFFRLFTGVMVTWRTRAEVIQNPEA
jgi:hypothetical protein